jgi:hypothetical protein
MLPCNKTRAGKPKLLRSTSSLVEVLKDNDDLTFLTLPLPFVANPFIVPIAGVYSFVIHPSDVHGILATMARYLFVTWSTRPLVDLKRYH